MSAHLKNTVKKLIKENNGPLSLEEIIILLKNMPEYQRIKSESLKPTIKNLLKEEKKEKEKLKKENDLNSDTASQSFLNKKTFRLALFLIIIFASLHFLNSLS